MKNVLGKRVEEKNITQRVPRFFLIVVILAAIWTPRRSLAHFTLEAPVFSREKQAYPNDNERFWPIGGSNTLRPKLDCLDYPRGLVANIQAGSTVPFVFEIGNGAAHVGMCTSQLIDVSSGNVLATLNSQDNCVSSATHTMQVAFPTNITCNSCVVKVKVTATHVSVTNPELYDSCVDVNISSSGSAGATADLSSVKLSTNSLNQQQNSSQNLLSAAVPHAEATQNFDLNLLGLGDSNSSSFLNDMITGVQNQYVNYNSRRNRDNLILTQTQSGSQISQNGNSQVQTQITGANNLLTPNSRNVGETRTILTQSCSSSNNGASMCSSDGGTMYRCDWTIWRPFTMAAGTKCVIDEFGTARVAAISS